MISHFENIFTPLARADFIEQYFNKEPICLTGTPNRVGDLLSVDRFFVLLPKCENVRAVFNQLKQASIAPNDAQDMFDAGATICATGLERACPKLADVSRSIREELRFSGQISFRAYYSPNGVGFSHHYDPRVVTNIQVAGKKKWWFANAPVAQFPLTNSPVPIPDDFRDHLFDVGFKEIELAPGDLICLPAGTLHWAEASGGESLALNLAFDYIYDGIADAISTFIRSELLSNEQSRKAVFLPLGEVDMSLIRGSVEHCEKLLDQIRRDPMLIYKDRT
jgi:ribosomal protein L16 Arg81 hydroxylase